MPERVLTSRLWILAMLVSSSAAAPAPHSRPAAIQLDTQRVSFTTEDNLLVFAGYTPPPPRTEKAPLAVLVHMYRSDRNAFAPLVPFLHQAGFAVLALDLRGHGESVGPSEMRLAERVARRDRRLLEAMDKDVEAAVLWLLEQPEGDPARIALVGAGVGCSVALDYAARDKSVDAVVCLTPGDRDPGMDSIAAVEKYGRRPLLIMASETERSAAEQLARTGGDTRVKIYPAPGVDPEALHGTRMLDQVTGVERNIIEFMLQAAGPPSREPVVASLKGQVYYAPGAGMAARLSKRNVRWFSSPAEAEQRGLRAPRGGGRSPRSRPSPQEESFPDEPEPRPR